jgi:uncharacterized membrane protein YkoI
MINRISRAALCLFYISLLSSTMAQPSYADGNDKENNERGETEKSGKDQDNDDDDNSGSSAGQNNQGTNQVSTENEQERIRKAAKADEAVPLERLLSHVSKLYPGVVLDLHLRRSKSIYVYSVKMLSPAGRIFRLKLNAKSLVEM